MALTNHYTRGTPRLCFSEGSLRGRNCKFSSQLLALISPRKLRLR